MDSHSKPLSGCVAVVTGASSGIGREIAIQLAGAGACVALASRKVDAMKKVSKEIEDKGGKSIVIQTDVTQRSQVKELIKTTEDKLGPVDILVTSAGVNYFTLMKNCLEDLWEETVDVNCKGVLHCLAAVTPGMIERKKGHIVNICSDDCKQGSEGLGVYAGSKSFVENTTNVLRRETAKTGIKLTNIYPGWVNTPSLDISVDPEADALNEGENETPILQPSDIARSVVFVVSQPPHVAINELLIQPTGLPNN